ncbi:hypothetical protein MRX96_025995 [Rhipicephalus microplus]
MMWHWTLITFPSCVLSSVLGLLYVYVFMFKQYEYVLDPSLQPRMLRLTAKHLKKTPNIRYKELLHMVFLTTYGCLYLLARIAGTDDKDAQLCVLCSMVVVTSAVAFEQRQTEKEINATDCWSRFPWLVFLVLGAVKVLSKIIEANNTLTKTLRPSSWMQKSPLTVQIVLAVVAALLSEAMNNESLSRMLLPLTINAVLAGLVMKTALLSTLIISMNTTAQYIYISPAVRALNSTSLASRNQAPHY